MDTAQSLLGRKPIAIKSVWFTDVADIFVLFCSFLFSAASVVLVVLVFHFQGTPVQPETPPGFIPFSTLSLFQRTIFALSVTIAAAVIVVTGRRYVLFRLTRGGIQSQRVTVYASLSIGTLASYLVRHGFELLLLALLTVWALALTTGLTTNNTWTTVPLVGSLDLAVPSGSFDTSATPDTYLASALQQFIIVAESVCTGVAGIVGLIKIGGDLQLASGGPMGVIYYPPLPLYTTNSAFSFSTSLNGFNISMEPLASIPPAAQNLTCLGEQFWYEGGDNQTLSMIVPQEAQLYRINASAIILGGTLHSTGNSIEFMPNGTTWPNVMPDDQWAKDIANLVCNATAPASTCPSQSLMNFSLGINAVPIYSTGWPYDQLAGIYLSTVFGTAMGVYSAAWNIGTTQEVTATQYGTTTFSAHYGAYVLIANIMVSMIMLIVVVRLRMGSRLNGDFINATRLLLDPLKDPELFNATLNATVNALGNPYMSVSENNQFLLTESSGGRRKRRFDL